MEEVDADNSLTRKSDEKLQMKELPQEELSKKGK